MMKKYTNLINIFILIYPLLNSFQIADSEITPIDDIILLENKIYMQPYTFLITSATNESILGLLWVQTRDDLGEAIFYKTYDGVDFSATLQIAPFNNPGTYHGPTACVCNDTIVFLWAQKINETFQDINLRQYQTLSGLGSIKTIMKNLYFWEILDNDSYNDYGTIYPIYYQESLIILYSQFRALYYVKYDVDTEIISPTEYILFASGVNFFEHRNQLFICYDQVQGQGQYFYRLLLELNTFDPVNMSMEIPLPLELACYYGYGDLVFEYGSKMLFNQPHPYYFSDDWIINMYDYKTQDIKTTKILNSPIFVTKTTLYDYERDLHIAYIDNSSGTYDKLYYMCLENETLTKPVLLDDRFKCDYTIGPLDILSKVYLSLHMIKTSEEKILCAIWSSKDENHDGIYLLHLKKICTEYIFKPALYVSSIAVYTNETVTFIGQITSEHHTYEFLFDFGDDNTTDWTVSSIADHAYPQNGIYTVRLKARNELGIESNWTSHDVVIVNRRPVINASISRASVLTGEDILFFSNGSFDPDGTIIKTKWDFGDGTNSQSADIIHNYTTKGAYTVVFSATDDDYDSASRSFVIIVNNSPPVIEAKPAKTEVQTGEDVIFSSGGTFDPDGKITNFTWDFGDGNSSSDPTPIHNYSKAGMYVITLTVRDNDGANSTTSFVIRVTGRPPTCEFAITPAEGSIFTDFSFVPHCQDPDGIVSKYYWDFGDGTTSDIPSPSHSYTEKRTYYISCRVTDDDGLQSELVRKSVIVRNNPPVIDLIPDAQSILTLETVDFRTHASDNDGRIAFYLWDFGDGSNGSGPNITHKYRNDGFYNVTLRAVDDDLAEDFASVQITVLNRPPLANAIFEPGARVGKHLKFDASRSSDLDGKIVSWRWTIDDKTLDGERINWSFKTPGKHIMTLTVTDDDGASTEQIYEISVMEVKTSPELSIWIPITILIFIGALVIGIRIYLRKSKQIKPH